LHSLWTETSIPDLFESDLFLLCVYGKGETNQEDDLQGADKDMFRHSGI